MQETTATIKPKDFRFLSEEEQAIEIAENKQIQDEYFEVEYAKALMREVLEPVDQLYFRSEFINFDELPERNQADHPLIYISNHSGMAFPWDAIMFTGGLYKRNDYRLAKVTRPLSAPILSQSDLMNPYLIHRLWKKVGGVDATFLNFETMMHYRDSNVLIYPEGIPGIGKGFNRKYQLQRFATSFIRMSLKYKTDVIPVLTVNAEYINPYTYSFKFINKWSQKIGLSFIPIGLLTPFLFFVPWLFYYAWPAKLTFVRGERISPYKMIVDKPFEEVTETEIKMIRDQVQLKMQIELDKAVEKYGRKPLQLKEFIKIIFNNLAAFPYYLPFGWPFTFLDFDRQYRKGVPLEDIRVPKGWGAFWKLLFNNLMAIAFFIPILGWIPILWKGYRK